MRLRTPWRSGVPLAAKKTSAARRMRLEPLEDRRLLAFTVNHTPYLQLGNAALDGLNGGADQVEILWQTTGAQDSDAFIAEYRENGAGSWTSAALNAQIVTGVGGRIVHSATLATLNFDDDYDYQITHLRGGNPIAIYQNTFHTRLAAGDNQNFSFVAYGDSAVGDPPDDFIGVQEQINLVDPAFSVLLGDNIYTSGTHAEHDLRLDPSKNAPLTTYNQTHVDYYGFGNHDVGSANGQPARDNYSLPIPVQGSTSPVGLAFDTDVQTEKNYSFDYGSAHFVSFDTNLWQNTTALDKQLDWAEADIAAARARPNPPRWVVVFGHHPVISLVSHTEHTADDNYYEQVVSRLGADGAAVDLFLAGHTHNYQRSYPLTGRVGSTPTYLVDTDNNYAKGAGLNLVIQGTGGVGLGYGVGDAAFAGTHVAVGIDTATTVPMQFGFGKIDVTPNQLVYSYLSDTGQTLDSFVISGGPDSIPPTAALGTPLDNGPSDQNPAYQQVLVNAAQANLQIQLSDLGDGVDDASVVAAVVSITKDSAPLVHGVDYTFGYDAGANRITLTPIGGNFGNGSYAISLTAGIEDLNNNPIAPITLTVTVDNSLPIQVAFRNGENGYGAALDTYLHQDESSALHGTSTKIVSDGDDDLGTAETPPQIVQGLIRFNSLFASRGGGPIPDGATIVSATLTVRTGTSSNDQSESLFTLHRMLSTWSESATWDNMVGGVSLDGIEAVASATDLVNGPIALGGIVSFDVTADLQTWSDNVALSTRGWVIHPLSGSDGWRVDSSDASTIANRPQLAVVYQIGPTSASAGGPYTLDEGASLTLAASATGVGMFNYHWDVNGDNVFGDASGIAPVLNWSQLTALGIADGLASFNVRVRVDDGLGHSLTSSPVALTLNNVAPSADVTGPTNVLRGQSTSFNLSAVDPSSVDQAGSFVFQIDWNGDGIYDETTAAGLANQSVSHVFAANAALNVRVRAVDEDGGVGATVTLPIVVSGVSLGADLDNPLLGSLYYTGTAGADHVVFEQLGPDAVRVQTLLENGAVFALDQTFTGVTGRVIANALAGGDELDAALITTTAATLIGGLGHDTLTGGAIGDRLYGDLSGNGLGELNAGGNDVIAGGAGDDLIYGDFGGDGGEGGNDNISAGSGADTVFGDAGGDGGEGGDDTIAGGSGDDIIYGDFGGDGGEGGDDAIFGESGDDSIVGDFGVDGGEGGNDIIHGGADNDTLSGDFMGSATDGEREGADIVIGGTGADSIYGWAALVGPAGFGGDILIGGEVTHDQTALEAIRLEWISANSYADRVANITNGSGSVAGVNGTNFLAAGATVFDDAAVDQIWGESATADEWFLLKLTEDLLSGDQPGETKTNTP